MNIGCLLGNGDSIVGMLVSLIIKIINVLKSFWIIKLFDWFNDIRNIS